MFIIIFLVLIVISCLCYNTLITNKNKVKNAWSHIDVELQRRFDLIPNLVETVKKYASHEEKVFTNLTELRTSWLDAKTVNEKSDLNNKLSSSLKSIIAVAENYPDLKASQNFKELQLELCDTENKIAVARQTYNQCVTDYNTKLEIIPTNIIAFLFRFKSEELFKVETEEVKNNVKVEF